MPDLMTDITRRIVAGYDPDKIILFGSYAYGTPAEGSDIDLFIVKDDNRRGVDRYCSVMKSLMDIKGVPVEPVILTSGELKKRLELQDDFILEIMARGKVLYERK